MYKSVICCLMLLSVGVIGCSGSGGAKKLPTYKVTGKVMMNGSPVPGASVSFSPVEGGRPPALGISDTQGMYVLTTYDSGDGAVAGDYKVMVFKGAPASAPATPTHDPTGQTSGGAPKHSAPGGKAQAAAGGSLLPEKYSKAATTPLTKSVTSGENNIDIEL